MRKKIVLLSLILLCFIAFIALSGCTQTDKKMSYRIFATQANAVDAAMKTAGDAYRTGKISEADRVRIVNAYDAYKKTFDIAIDEYAAYERLPEDQKDDSIKKISVAVSVMASRLADLEVILRIFDIEVDL